MITIMTAIGETEWWLCAANLSAVTTGLLSSGMAIVFAADDSRRSERGK